MLRAEHTDDSRRTTALSDRSTRDGMQMNTPQHDERDRGDDTGAPSGRARPAGLGALLVALLVGVAACSNPLDVENPNNLVAGDLNNPQGLTSAVNGALSTTTFAVSDMLAPYAAATDQIENIGSRDAWRQLDYGNIANPDNEFTDGAFPSLGEARYMADKAIRLAREFDEEGTIPNRVDLARAYFYGSIIYASVADMMDDFVISEPGEGAPAIGPDNMDQMYQTALDYLESGLQVAQSEGASDLVTRMRAMEARIHFSRGVWNKLNPAGSTPSDPLVDSDEAVQAAQAVLSRVGTQVDWRYDLQYSSAAVPNSLGGWISNNYITIEEGPVEGGGFVNLDGDDNITEITFTDPIDTTTAAPEVARVIAEYQDEPSFASITALSARELHLILAESALAEADTAGFTTHINHVRAMDELTPYSGQIPEMEMLMYSRKANLFLQGRRLADMYRFGVEAPYWQEGSAAASQPGTFFPITRTELRANDNLGG